MHLRNIVLIVACGIVSTTSAAPASMRDVPPDLRKNAECMLEVLKTVPGVSDAKLGVSDYGGWAHPFLQYRASEKASWEEPTRFDVQKPADIKQGTYWFMAMLPGVTAVGEKLDAHVSRAVVQQWKARCGVDANILFE